MKTLDLALALRILAVLLFVAAIIRMVYFVAAPALEYGFTVKPRAWFQIRFYLSQLTDAFFEPFVLLAFSELVKLKGNRI